MPKQSPLILFSIALLGTLTSFPAVHWSVAVAEEAAAEEEAAADTE